MLPTQAKAAFTGRWVIWSLGLSKYIQSIKKEKGDTLHDVVATIGFGLFTTGMVAPELYYATVGKIATRVAVTTAPFVAGAALGAAIGVTTTALITSHLEEEGVLSEGATLDYLEQHKDFDTAWENIYSPTAIGENISTIWTHLFPEEETADPK
jgi:hypothetical protein